MRKQFIYGLLIGAVIGSAIMGLVMSSPAKGECCIESPRPVIPRKEKWSPDGGWTFDSNMIYCGKCRE